MTANRRISIYFNVFLYISTVFLTLNLTGCDAMQRKLTRKKTTVKQPRFYQIKKYTKKPSPELYKKHFAYWASWQEDLIQSIGQNHKRDIRGIEEALGHLKDMQNILIPSKADELQPHVEKMEAARTIILRSDLSFASRDYVRGILDREDRAIKRDFCYSKVKDDLRKSSDEDAAPQLKMAAGQEVAGEPKK